nr:ElyC/SanA/YdcF family protein [Propionicimonas sp.]
MGRFRTARALVATMVATAFLAVTGGVVADAPSHAAQTVSISSLKARAIYFQQAGKTADRDLAVSSMAATSAWEAKLWSGFVASWSSINNAMTMNTSVPSGLPGKGHVFVVLGSALTSSGKMSAKFERRLKLAVKALQKYPAATVLVSGGAARNGVTEGEAGRKWLLAKGVDESRIAVEKKSSSTIGNAKNSMALLATSNASSYSLISDSSHLRRASVLFDAASVLVQEGTGKAWSMERLANVAYPDMAGAGQGPLSDSSVAYTAGNVASLFGVSSAYNKLVSAPPTTPVLTGLTVTAPAKVTYRVGENLSTKGLVVKAVYDKGAYAKVVTSAATLSGFDSTAVGTGETTASYTDGEVTKTSSFRYSVIRAASKLSVKLSTKTIKRKKTRVVAKATVAASTSRLVPTGTMRFFLDGKLLKSIPLTAGSKGQARFTYPKISKAGKHKIVVKYLGNDTIEPARTPVTVKAK